MRSHNSHSTGLIKKPNSVDLAMYWALWTTIALLNAASQMIQTPEFAKWKPLLWEFSSLYTVGALYPLVAHVARRFPFSRRKWIYTVSLHIAFLIVFSAMHTSGMVVLRKVGYWIAGESYTFGGGIRVLYEFYKDIVLYPALIGLTRGIDYYRAYRENELRAEQLQRRLVEAQLQNLRGQLNPHFLFNALNMISARMYEDVSDADRMIARLSDLLRMTLHSSNEPELPLRVELEVLDLYLEIMKGRFSDSVRVHMNIDPKTRQAMVPSLVLQPLVENAFRHGAGNKIEGGLIEILTMARNGTLTLIVRDDGPGMPGDPRSAFSKGLGLSNTAERLRQLYGDRHQMRIRNRPAGEGGGLEIAIEIPARFDN
jgi:two-component system, LytTR family, sensor kinase